MVNLKLLNDQQKLAVTTSDEKVFVVAGAGCGKTRVLTYRIAYLLECGIMPSFIYAFTFTNKAAFEMKERVKELLGFESGVHLSTFHSFAYKIVQSNFDKIGFKENIIIIDDDEKKKIIRHIIESTNSSIVDVDAIKEISNIKSHSKVLKKKLVERVELLKIYFKYQDILKKSNKMDFDDLLVNLLELLINSNYNANLIFKNSFILVDECQDINNIQYEIINALAAKSNRVFMVGDEDQCIYSFRGSSLSCIKDFINNRHATIIKLEQNYRSCKNILDAANSVIDNNYGRVEKRLFTNYLEKNYKLIISNFDNDIEESIYICDLIEELLKHGYSYRDFTILYRNNIISIPVEKEMVKRNIPYFIFGKSQFFKKKEIRIILSYLKFIINPDDNLSFLDIVNYPCRGIGEEKIQQIKLYSLENNKSYYQSLLDLIEINGYSSFISFKENMCHFLDIKSNIILVNLLDDLINKIDYLNELKKEKQAKEKISNVYSLISIIKDLDPDDDFKKVLTNFINDTQLENDENKNEKDCCKLMTIHQSKGLEYKIVIVAGCNDGIIPASHSSIELLEEERRIFYVAITRAKERLYLLSSRRRLINGQYKNFEISPFILEINTNNITFN